MNLYHFAHKMEAHSFLNASTFESIQSPVGQLFKNDLGLIMVSGEGIFNALKSTLYVLTKYPEVKNVINLGVAGALDQSLKVGEIYTIRTVYGMMSDKPEFNSFNANGTLDCISSNTRILEDAQAKKTSYFAPIVDRELWGVAQACSIGKISLHSIKLISDFAGKNTLCNTIKDQGQEYSEKLYQYFSEHPLMNSEDELKDDQDETLPNGFHFTAALKNQFLKLNQKVIIDEDLLTEIKELEPRPKKRAIMLTQRMKNLSQPFNYKIQELLKDEVNELNLIGAKTFFDPSLEKESFSLRMDINSEKNIENLKLALNKTSYTEIQKIINGQKHV